MPRCHTCLTTHLRVWCVISPRVYLQTSHVSLVFVFARFCSSSSSSSLRFFLCYSGVSISMAFSLRTKTFTFIEGEAPTQWWNEIDDSDQWQRSIYYTLCAAYATVSFIALVRNFLAFSSKIIDQSLYHFGFQTFIFLYDENFVFSIHHPFDADIEISETIILSIICCYECFQSKVY